jgi:type III secretory pathway component EscV
MILLGILFLILSIFLIILLYKLGKNQSDNNKSNNKSDNTEILKTNKSDQSILNKNNNIYGRTFIPIINFQELNCNKYDNDYLETIKINSSDKINYAEFICHRDLNINEKDKLIIGNSTQGINKNQIMDINNKLEIYSINDEEGRVNSIENHEGKQFGNKNGIKTNFTCPDGQRIRRVHAIGDNRINGDGLLAIKFYCGQIYY